MNIKAISTLAGLLLLMPLSHADILWIGTFTTKEARGIYRAEFDPKSGLFGSAELVAPSDDPAFLAVHPSLKVLYSIGRGSVAAYDYDVKGELTMRNVIPASGKGPCHLDVSPDGRLLAVANYWSGSNTAYRLMPEGNIQGAMKTIVHKGSGPVKDRQDKAHCNGTYYAGGFLFATDLGCDRIFAYLPKDGFTAPAEPPFWEARPSDGPRHLAFHKDQRHVFVVHELSNVLECLSREGAKLTSLCRMPLSSAGENDTTSAEVVIHPDGRWVFVSTRGSDVISIFKFDTETSTVVPHASTKARVKVPRHFTISPNGKWLLVAGQESNELRAFSFNPDSGNLEATESILKVPTPTCLIFKPER